MTAASGTARTRIGILALQGDFAAHEQAIRRAGGDPVAVRMPHQLADVAGLVMPGGESTTLLKHFGRYGFEGPLRRFHADGGAFLATCAGAILLAREVRNPAQASLGIGDFAVERNAYGRQVASFHAPLDIAAIEGGPLDAIFIRAPRIVDPGPGLEVLARYGDDPVLLRGPRLLVATFHPELTDDPRIHRLFVGMVPGGAATP